MTPKPTLRCAVYTRKSTEEGLEQDFNSLDAQYESCVAYIASQRHEGWKLVAERFDDGGLSGGTLERPALRRLMAEIDAGRIAMVVVYKIDRLTRSLADFVRLVERLEAKGCSFVSVTQAFNTSSSMGRLTLNVLLSFAQFEREVTAERIRDKIAASKKKGLWMGDSLPLGYDRHTDPLRRELVINPIEAHVVRTLFHLYDATPNLCNVEREAARLGLRPKAKAGDAAAVSQARRFSRGQLHYLMTNPTYLGRIRRRTLDYPGLHAAIIDQALWDSVQIKLQSTSARPRGPATTAPPVRCLMGKLRDETGDLLTPTHTERRGRKYGYYISHRLIRDGTDNQAWRLPAPALEATLRAIVVAHLAAAANCHAVLTAPDATEARDVARNVVLLCQRIEAEPACIARLIDAVVLHRDRIELRLAEAAIAAAIGRHVDELATDLTCFDHAFTLKRRGVETRIHAGAFQRGPDPVLIRVLAEACACAKVLRSGTSLTALVTKTGRSEPYLRTRLPLAFLSPKLQTAILEGKQPPDLSVAKLIASEIPLDWVEQERLFS